MAYPYSTFPTQFYGGPPFTFTPNTAVGAPKNIFTGGVVFAAGTQLQNTRLFDTVLGMLPSQYWGVRSGKSDNNPVIGNDGALNNSKALSTGKFGIMVQNKYVIMGFCTQLASVTNTVLQTTGSNLRKSQNVNIGYFNSQRISSTGGWYYMNGLPVNQVLARDSVNTETYPGTYALPGRLTFLTGSPTVTTTSYKPRGD